MGSKAPSTTIVQPPPPTVTQLPQPSPSETSRQLYETQLEYLPKQQALEFQLAQQYLPQYQSLTQQQYPQVPILQRQTQQALESPYSLNPQQQAAQDAIRQRQRDELSRNIRSQANLGGNLYSGNREDLETRAQAELSNQYANSDIGLQQQQRQATLQDLIALGQLAGFPVQQIAPTQVGNVGVSPDALLQAMQNSIFVQPAAIGFGPSARSQNLQFLGALAGAAGAAAGHACHVAEVLYGMDAHETFLARAYVATHDSWFLRLYRRYSKTWAAWLTRIPWLHPLVKPIWDTMARRQWREEAVQCPL